MKRRLIKYLTVSLLLLVFVSIIWVIAIISIGGEVKRGCGGNAHCIDGEYIKAAVKTYMDSNDGAVPIVNNSVVNVSGWNVIEGENYYVIAACPLLDTFEFLPATLEAGNCASGGANGEGCKACNGSYRWLTTSSGDIASICIDQYSQYYGKCDAHNESGFQDVYP
jgi:hypothetical protein